MKICSQTPMRTFVQSLEPWPSDGSWGLVAPPGCGVVLEAHPKAARPALSGSPFSYIPRVLPYSPQLFVVQEGSGSSASFVLPTGGTVWGGRAPLAPAAPRSARWEWCGGALEGRDGVVVRAQGVERWVARPATVPYYAVAWRSNGSRIAWHAPVRVTPRLLRLPGRTGDHVRDTRALSGPAESLVLQDVRPDDVIALVGDVGGSPRLIEAVWAQTDQRRVRLTPRAWLRVAAHVGACAPTRMATPFAEHVLSAQRALEALRGGRLPPAALGRCLGWLTRGELPLAAVYEAIGDLIADGASGDLATDAEVRALDPLGRVIFPQPRLR